MSRPTREQVARALAASDYPDAPTPSATDWRRAAAVIALFHEQSTGDAEAEAITEVTPKTVQQQADLIETWAHDHPLREAALDLLTQQPRETVTTVEELDALPVGSVVLRDGRVWIKSEVPPDGFGIEVGWFCTGIKDYFLRPHLPVTVLHRPEETP